MKIETPRILIRNFIFEDAPDLFEILGDEETMKYSEPAYSFEKVEIFLKDFCIEKRGALAAIQKVSGKMIGYILFNETEPGIYEIGWFFNRNYWKQGYALEACKAVIDYAFTHGIARKIFAETIDREKSVPLMKKLGMAPECMHTDDITNNITRDLHSTPCKHPPILYIGNIFPAHQ